MTSRSLRFLIIFCFVALIATACGGGDDDETPTPVPTIEPTTAPAPDPTSVPATASPTATPSQPTASPSPTQTPSGPVVVVPPDVAVTLAPVTLAVLEGKAQYRTSATGEWLDAFDAQPVEQGWQVRTLAISTAVLEFSDGSRVKLDPTTEVALELFLLVDGGPSEGGERHARLRLINGNIDFDVAEVESPPSTWVFATTDGSVAIQGTRGGLERRVGLVPLGDVDGEPGVQLEVEFNVELLDGDATLVRVASDPDTGDQVVQALVLEPLNVFSSVSISQVPDALLEGGGLWNDEIDPDLITDGLDTDGNGGTNALELVFSEDLAFAAGHGLSTVIGGQRDSVTLKRGYFEISGTGDNPPVGGFAEVSGLSVEVEYNEYRNGNEDGVSAGDAPGPFGVVGTIVGGPDALPDVAGITTDADGDGVVGISWREFAGASGAARDGAGPRPQTALSLLAELDNIALGGAAAVGELQSGSSPRQASRMAVSKLSSESKGAKVGAGHIYGATPLDDADDDESIEVQSVDWAGIEPGSAGSGGSRREGAEILDDLTLTTEYESRASVSLRRDLSALGEVDGLTGERLSVEDLGAQFTKGFSRPQAEAIFDINGVQVGLKLPDQVVFEPNGEPIGKKIGDLLATDAEGNELPDGIVPDVFYRANPFGQEILHPTTFMNSFVPTSPGVEGETGLETVELHSLAALNSRGQVVPTISLFDERGRPTGTTAFRDDFIDGTGNKLDPPGHSGFKDDDGNFRVPPLVVRVRDDNGEPVELLVPEPVAHDKDGNVTGIQPPCKITKGDIGIIGLEIGAVLDRDFFIQAAREFEDLLAGGELPGAADISALLDRSAPDRDRSEIGAETILYDSDGIAHTRDEFRPQKLFRDAESGEVTGRQILTEFQCFADECFQAAVGNEDLLDKLEQTVRTLVVDEAGEKVVTGVQGSALFTDDGNFAGYVPPPIALLGKDARGFAEVSGFAAAESQLFIRDAGIGVPGSPQWGFETSGGRKPEATLHPRDRDQDSEFVFDFAFGDDGASDITMRFPKVPLDQIETFGVHDGDKIIKDEVGAIRSEFEVNQDRTFGKAFGDDFRITSDPGFGFFDRLRDAEDEAANVVKEFFNAKKGVFREAHSGGLIDADKGFELYVGPEDGIGSSGLDGIRSRGEQGLPVHESGLPFDPNSIFGDGKGSPADGPRPGGSGIAGAGSGGDVDSVLDRFNKASDDAGSFESEFGGAVHFGTPGDDRGGFSIPEIGDEVKSGFVDGDPDRPVIVGGGFNGTDRPPDGPPDQGGKTGTGGREGATVDKPGGPPGEIPRDKPGGGAGTFNPDKGSPSPGGDTPTPDPGGGVTDDGGTKEPTPHGGDGGASTTPPPGGDTGGGSTGPPDGGGTKSPPPGGDGGSAPPPDGGGGDPKSPPS